MVELLNESLVVYIQYKQMKSDIFYYENEDFSCSKHVNKLFMSYLYNMTLYLTAIIVILIIFLQNMIRP